MTRPDGAIAARGERESAGAATIPAQPLLAVLEAWRNGDFTARMPADLPGTAGRVAAALDDAIGISARLAAEIARLNRTVGKDGLVGERADIGPVDGTWQACVGQLNDLIDDLVQPTAEVGRVIGAVASGDLSRTMAVEIDGRPLCGEFLRTAKVVNGMVEQLGSFASEVTRVAREVGTQGKLGGQAQVEGVAGTWKDLTDNVNSMASNLTAQVRNIAEVTTAVARGDLGRKITVDVKGEILELKNTINTMVDQLNGFASEVTRVAREVGTEGKLGGQAQVKGVAGTWKDLTDNVNSMASNLTAQVRNIAEVTTAVARGDLGRKITVDVKGEILELKNTINTMVDQLNGFASEVTRVAREVGTEGKLGGQAQVEGVAGTWKDLTDNVNSMASNLTAQVRNIAEVTTAVARGDLGRKITVDVKGEILELKNTINTMVDQLNGFASEVTRVAREVGTEGKLGGQARVPDVAGVWKDLTDNVNSMASNLTAQVRGIAKLVTAVARGDLTRKLALDARGEIAELAETINGMTETLATFAEQVTTVAREVGVEGKLGAQANVPGTAGTWRDLVDNVNQLAGNLTTQVRAIGDVARAVTKGDLTRSIDVEALGEVAALKDNINEMIRALRETTQKTTEQDWLKTNLARFTRMLQGQRDLVTIARQVLSELIPLVTGHFGVLYVAEPDPDGVVVLNPIARYADGGDGGPPRFGLGEGLVGQCALEKRKIIVRDLPPGRVRIRSGLGEAAPRALIVLPVLFEGQVNAVIELATFGQFSEIHMAFVDQLMESIGIVVNTISASMRTEALLKQSQSLTQELRKTNEQLEEKATLLELKNREVELAKREVEDKAEQLALTSKYKSQFLANMSHELRTPLNSLLILSRMLSDNVDGNLTPKQVEFARAIHTAGTDLLALITDILDLSKIESGTMSVDIVDVSFVDLRDHVEQSFRHVAQQKGLGFVIELDPALPVVLATDVKRLQQILKNLLSNAFKFTERGHVALRIRVVTGGWTPGEGALDRADQVIAFTVEDTGIGIPEDKQRIIFEAFQQADGTTSRKYGGTGLGLSISRELTRLIGGEIGVHSAAGAGTKFTLWLPRGASAEVSVPSAPRLEPVTGPVTTLAGEVSRSVIDSWTEAAAHEHVMVIIAEPPDVRAVAEAVGRHGIHGAGAAAGDAIETCRLIEPTAVFVDLELADSDGWVLLDLMAHDLATRHIPVIARCNDRARYRRARALGAIVISGPVRVDQLDRALPRCGNPRGGVAVLAADPERRARLTELIGGFAPVAGADDPGAVAVDAACVVVDAGSDGAAVRQLQDARPEVPLVVYTGEVPATRAEIHRLTATGAVRTADTPGALIAGITGTLRLPSADLPAAIRAELERYLRGETLSGARIAVVDDDVRNIFAITSALERHGAAVIHAESGAAACVMLERDPNVDLVLMDVMMPEMDGYEVMRRIRAQDRFRQLPMVALTARAMKSDRDKCLEAGATDYVAKPVDITRLVSIIRVWMAP